MDLATARLRRAPVQAAVIPLVIAMLRSMVPAREADHLSSLLSWANHRGSDVVLASGVIVNGSTQIAPHPALAWAWRCGQSYKWTASQHINVLELTTLLIFCALKRLQAACAVNDFPRFRQPSGGLCLRQGTFVFKALNRVCRRLCAILLATNSFCVSGQSPAGKSATLDPGSRNLTTMVRRRRLAPVRRAHLKFVGIERKTQRKYNKAVKTFFIFCTFFHGSQPNSGKELNFLLSEFVNHLWQDDEPYQNAVDTVAAVRRYLPTYRSHTSTAQAYLRNRGRTRTVRRALPLPLSALLGIVGHAALYEDWATAAACYIGYLCLLRTGEILTLKVQHVVHYEESHKSVLCLPDSKGTKRKNVSEFVLVHDPVARQLLRIMVAGKSSDDSVFGLRGPLLHVVFARRQRVTVRRGDATFQSHSSLLWMQARHENTSLRQ